MLLRLNWVAVLYGKIKADLAVTGGVHSGMDVLKSMMAGARVAMMTSALLRNGIGHLATVQAELLKWMEEHEYESIHQMQGSMSQRVRGRPLGFPEGELRQGAELVCDESWSSLVSASIVLD